MATSKHLQPRLVHFMRLYRCSSSPNNVLLRRPGCLTFAAGNLGYSTTTTVAASRRFLQLQLGPRRLPINPILMSSQKKYTSMGQGKGPLPPPQATSSSSSDGNSSGDDNESPPLPPLSPPSSTGRWIKWALGSILSLALSFWFPKWATVLRIGGQAEVAIEEVEHAAEVIDRVANMAAKVSEDMADHLPTDQSKLKQAALMVEKVSKEAAKDARFVEEFIRKVEELKHDIGDVENMAEHVIKEIVDDIKRTKL